MEPNSPDSTEGLGSADSTSLNRVQQLNGIKLNLGFTLNSRDPDSVAMPEIFDTKSPDYGGHQQMFNALLSECGEQFKSSDPSPAGGSPILLSPGISTVVSESLLADVNTQMSLVEKSADLQLDDNDPTSFWNVLNDGVDQGDGVVGGRKVRKSSRQSDAPSTLNATLNSDEDARVKVFDAALASTTSDFSFTMFGSDANPMFAFGGKDTKPNIQTSDASSTSATLELPTSSTDDPFINKVEPTTSTTEIINIQPLTKCKEPSLNARFPSKANGYEIKLLQQPEEQHRARYMTEGSRGAIKDKSGNGYPVVKLYGINQPVNVMVYIGTDSGQVKPHGFYQACKVCSKNATPCTEREVEGTCVIDIMIEPKDDMTATIDCVGILKLRNADVEQRIGVARSKKKSTRARMIFRVIIPKQNGKLETLQVPSTSISCTQPAGQPEICKMSLAECTPDGGKELFIIGKNFLKGTNVYFREKRGDDVIWTKEATYDSEYFHGSHMIVTVPPYKDTEMATRTKVEILVVSASRSSDPVEFFYGPGESTKPRATIKHELVTLETVAPDNQASQIQGSSEIEASPPASFSRQLDFGESSDAGAPCQEVTAMDTDCFKSKFVSPEAIALNQLFEKANRENNGASCVQELCSNNTPEAIDIEMPDPAKKRRTSVPETICVNECLTELHELQQHLMGEQESESKLTDPESKLTDPERSDPLLSQNQSGHFATTHQGLEGQFGQPPLTSPQQSYPGTPIQQNGSPAFSPQDNSHTPQPQIRSPQNYDIADVLNSFNPQQVNNNADQNVEQTHLNEQNLPFNIVNHSQLQSPPANTNFQNTIEGTLNSDHRTIDNNGFNRNEIDQHFNSSESSIQNVHQGGVSFNQTPDAATMAMQQNVQTNNLPTNSFGQIDQYETNQQSNFATNEPLKHLNETRVANESDQYSMSALQQLQDQQRLKQRQQQQEQRQLKEIHEQEQHHQRLKELREQEEHHQRLKQLQEQERIEQEKKEAIQQALLATSGGNQFQQNFDQSQASVQSDNVNQFQQTFSQSQASVQSDGTNQFQQNFTQPQGTAQCNGNVSVVSQFGQPDFSQSQVLRQTDSQAASQQFMVTQASVLQPGMQVQAGLAPPSNVAPPTNVQAQHSIQVQPNAQGQTTHGGSEIPQVMMLNLNNTLQEVLTLLKGIQPVQPQTPPQVVSGNQPAQADGFSQHHQRLIRTIQQQADAIPIIAEQSTRQFSHNVPQPDANSMQQNVQPQQMQPVYQNEAPPSIITASLPPTQMSSIVQQPMQPKPEVTSAPAVPQPFKLIPCTTAGVSVLQNRGPGQQIQLLSAENIRFLQEQMRQQNVQHTNVVDLASLLQQNVMKHVPQAPIQSNAVSQQMPIFHQATPTQVTAIASRPIELQSDATVLNGGTRPILINGGQATQTVNLVTVGNVTPMSSEKSHVLSPTTTAENTHSLLVNMLKDHSTDHMTSANFVQQSNMLPVSVCAQLPVPVSRHAEAHQPMDTSGVWNGSNSTPQLPKLNCDEVEQALKLHKQS